MLAKARQPNIGSWSCGTKAYVSGILKEKKAHAWDSSKRHEELKCFNDTRELSRVVGMLTSASLCRAEHDAAITSG